MPKGVPGRVCIDCGKAETVKRRLSKRGLCHGCGHARWLASLEKMQADPEAHREATIAGLRGEATG